VIEVLQLVNEVLHLVIEALQLVNVVLQFPIFLRFIVNLSIYSVIHKYGVGNWEPLNTRNTRKIENLGLGIEMTAPKNT
jgi:hypothetical protein